MLKEFFDLAHKNWFRPVGLICAIILALLVEVSVLASLQTTKYINSTIFLITIILIVIIWAISRKIPKVSKNKIGFAVCIYCSQKDEMQKIREDFITSLKVLIKRGSVGKFFQFIEIPQHVAEKIGDEDDAQRLRLKCKAHFLLYGRVRHRNLKGKPHHVLDISGLVAHKPITAEISKKFSGEFAELLPKQISIDEENDLFAFEFTSEWINIVSKYIIGIAAALSFDLNFAEILFSEVASFVKDRDDNFPVFVKIKQRIYLRLAEINEAQASLCYRQWLKTRNPLFVDSLGSCLDKIKPEHTSRYEVLLLRTIYCFLKNRDIDAALQNIKRCKKLADALWHFNLAFLYAYKGDLKEAIRHYRAANDCPVNPEKIAEIEEFILWLVDTEPHKYQLYYCLGFLNWKIKGDNIQAFRDFKKFLELRAEDEFLIEKGFAEKWISEIQVNHPMVLNADTASA